MPTLRPSLCSPLAALLAAGLLLSIPPAAAQDLPRGPAQRGVNASEAPDVWLATPEGFRLFEVRSVSANEALGQSATYSVTATTSDRELTAQSLLGLPVTLGVRTSPSRFHHVHGLVRSASVRVTTGPDDEVIRHVHLDIASPLHLLASSFHNRVFEDVPLVDVVRAVFAGYPGIPLRVAARLPPTRRTIVQRDETDLDFLQRLLEPEGAALLVEGNDRQATAVLTDGRGRPRHVRQFGEAEGFPQLDLHRRLPDSAFVVRPPVAANGAPRILSAETAAGVYGRVETVVQLPGSVSDEGARRILRGLGTEMSTIGSAILSGGPLPGCGDVMVVEGHDDAALNGPYRVLSTTWGADLSGGGGGQRYATLTVIRARPTLPGRPPNPPRRHGLERVHVVAGPDGTARTDSQGRVRIRFLWGPQPDGATPELWAPVLGARPPGGAVGFVMFEDGLSSAPRLIGHEAP